VHPRHVVFLCAEFDILFRTLAQEGEKEQKEEAVVKQQRSQGSQIIQDLPAPRNE
jgi:hypothetical protein